MITEISFLLNVLLAIVLSLAVAKFYRSKVALLALISGAITPLLWVGISYITSDDIVQFTGLLPAATSLLRSLLLFAAGGLFFGFAFGVRRGCLVGFNMLLGWGFFLLFSLCSLTGAVFPYFDLKLSYPFFQGGHPWLVAILSLLTLLVLFLREKRLWHIFMIVTTAVYLLSGVSFYAYLKQGIDTPQARLLPARAWPIDWWIISSQNENWHIQRLQVGKTPEQVAILPQWDNQPLLTYLLTDSVAASFYYDFFSHPIVRIQKNQLGWRVAISEALPFALKNNQRALILNDNNQDKIRTYTFQKVSHETISPEKQL